MGRARSTLLSSGGMAEGVGDLQRSLS